jgi:hypothetical protein
VDKTISQIATKEVAPHTVLDYLKSAQCLGQCFEENRVFKYNKSSETKYK